MTTAINLAIAIGTALAAFSAWKAALATKQSAQASTFVELFDRYASEEMAYNLRLLRDWRQRWPESDSHSWVDEWLKAVKDDTDPEHSRASAVHKARREVLYYFMTCWYLLQTRALSEKHFALLVNEETGEIFVKVAAPLTKVWGPKSRFNGPMYDIAKRLSLKSTQVLSRDIPNIDPLRTRDESR